MASATCSGVIMRRLAVSVTDSPSAAARCTNAATCSSHAGSVPAWSALAPTLSIVNTLNSAAEHAIEFVAAVSVRQTGTATAAGATRTQASRKAE